MIGYGECGREKMDKYLEKLWLLNCAVSCYGLFVDIAFELGAMLRVLENVQCNGFMESACGGNDLGS